MTKVVSWDNLAINDGTNYSSALRYSHSLPTVSPTFIQRTNADTLIGNVSFPARQLSELGIVVEDGGSVATIQSKFDPRSRQAKALVISDDDGGNQRYVMAYCVALEQVPGSGGVSFVATLFIHGDVAWRAAISTAALGILTASGQTVAVANNGNMFARPKFTITPTAAGGGNDQRRFMYVPWTEDRGELLHPVDIAGAGLDTRIASTNFASATGDDIRVWVNGSPADFWLAGINTASTKVWVNLDFRAAVALTLDGGIDASATSLVFNEAIDALPVSGILRLNSGEMVTYTAKNTASKTVSGVTRGAKGTSAATQADGTAVSWVQHDIWLTYGDGSLAAYVTDDTRKPAFNLASSTNAAWVYSGEFGDNGRLRSGGWHPGGGLGGNTANAGYCYTRDHSGGGSEITTPWDAIGLAQSGQGVTRWVLHSVRGISAANFSAGDKKTETAAAAASFAAVESATDGNNWTGEYAIPATSGTTWESWSQNVTGLYTASSKETKYVALRISQAAADTESYKVQATAVTITHQNGITPVIGSEAVAYSFSGLTVTDGTTGYAFRVSLPGALNSGIEIDTANRTAVRLDDNSNILDAVTWIGGVRAEQMPLEPGNTTYTFEEAGLAGITVGVSFEARYYD